MEKMKNNEFRGCGWLWYGSYGFDDVNVYMMARREFNLKKVPDIAEIKVTADSRYKLYVNGNYVCYGPARGYPESYPFDRVNIAHHLKRGKNVLAVLVHQFGHGTFQSIYAGAGGLLVSGKISGIDIGTKPKTWLVKKCPGHKQDTIRRSIQMGYQENFDVHLADPWKLPGNDIREGKDGWTYGVCRPVGCLPWLNLEEREIPLMKEEIKNFKAVLKIYSSDCSPDWKNTRNLTEIYLKEQRGIETPTWVRNEKNMLKPDSSSTRIPPFPSKKRLTLIIDFGEEVAGFLGIKAEGKGGEVIDFTTAESLEGEWLCVKDPETGCKVAFSDRFILKEGHNNLETFAVHGFRYLAVTFRNIRKPLKLYHLYVRQTCYPFKKKAEFNCSDETINKIWNMCVRTQINCSLDAYVDCPWREQTQWWGDARVQGANTFHLFGDMRLFRRGVKQAGQSQIPNGLTYGHFPTMAVGCILPDFTLTWIHTHMDYYRYTGDKSLLKEQFSEIQKALRFFQNYVKENGMLGPMPEWWVFFDWAPLYKNGYSAFFNFLYLSTLRQMVEICKIIRKEGNEYRKDAAVLEKKILKYFWSEKDKVFYDGFDLKKKKQIKKLSQHTHSFAILLELKPECHKKFAEDILLPPMKKPPLTSKKIIEATPFFYFYVLNALKKVGGYEREIVDFIRQRWGQMLKEGSTTCYEIWNPIPGYNSLCHAWSAHSVVYLTNILAGLEPLTPNWERFSISPVLLNLDWLNLTLPTRSGKIEIKLKRKDREINLDISVPEGTTGNLKVKGLKRNLKPGKYTLTYPENRRRL